VGVPDRGGQGEDALQDPDRDLDPCPAAVALQVQLALEGVVDRLDQLPQRFEQVCSRALGLALGGWSQQPHPQLAKELLELVAVVVLGGQQRLARPGGTSSDSTASRSSSTRRSSALAPVKAKVTGRPCRVQTRCSRSPQK
jgi:hypothetical protein